MPDAKYSLYSHTFEMSIERPKVITLSMYRWTVNGKGFVIE